jgi:hypothetical protein
MLKLDRRTLAQLLQGNHQAIVVFERMLGDVGGTLPSTIEEANALAGQALALVQVQGALLSLVAEALAQLEGAPAPLPQVDHDDTTPRAHLGTISSQNADQIEIIGGTIDSTPIGQTTAAAAKFTTVAASGQVTSSIADGTAPLVITSTTRVANLNVAAAGAADALTNPTNFPPAATDLPTVITLANALRAAAISKGL